MTFSGPVKSWLALAVAAYLLALFAISLYARRKVRSEEDFLVAGRSLPLFLSWGALMATWFGTSAIMGASRNAREEGLIGTLLDPWSCAATLLLAGLFFARRLWRQKLFTIGDFYLNQYGPRAEFVACAIQVPIFCLWVAAQYVGLRDLQHDLFGVPHVWAVLIAAGIVLLYTLIGGMWSVTLTDALQIAVSIFGLVALGYATFSHLGGGSVVEGVRQVVAQTDSDRLTLFPPPKLFAVLTWVGTLATGLFGNIPGQDLQQRIFASKDERVASLSCLLASALYLLFGLIPVALGLASSATHPHEIKGNAVLLHLAFDFLSTPLLIVFVLAVISIIVSVATSATIAPATILARNLLGNVRLFEGRHLLLDRVCVVAITAVAVAITFTDEGIIDLLDYQLSLAMVCLFVPLAMGLFAAPRGELAGLLPMLVGGALWLARFSMERFACPPPADVVANHEYPAYIARCFPAEQVGTIAHHALYGAAYLPADVLGLAGSFGAYFLAQWILSRR
ncbi:MAG: sodium:solute symporter family transporter [Planctomycetaceae bacterium]